MMWVALIACGGCLNAYAGQYDASELGQAAPMWTEIPAAVNNAGDVAWTAWDGTYADDAMSATFQNAAGAVDLQPSTFASGSSWTSAVSSRHHGAVAVGSAASSLRRSDQRAFAWLVNPVSPSLVDSVDLADHTPKRQGAGTVQQSSAYAIAPTPGLLVINGPIQYAIGGMARDKVANNRLPWPVIWNIKATASGLTFQKVTRLTTPGDVYGFVSGLSNIGFNRIWACGNIAKSGTYVQAMCWTKKKNARAWSQHTISSALKSAFGKNPTTSVVQRVRTIAVGPNGQMMAVAVGMALVDGSWHGWVHELKPSGAERTWHDFAVSPGADNMIYDVAGVRYPEVGASVDSGGFEVAGISGTVQSTNPPADPTPMTVDTTALRGVTGRVLISGSVPQGAGSRAVCTLAGDSGRVAAAQGPYSQTVSISPGRTWRVATSNSKLYLLTDFAAQASQLDVQWHHADIRHKEGQQSSGGGGPGTKPQRHLEDYAIRMPAGSRTKAQVRFGANLACDGLSSPIICGGTSPAAFDIDGQADMALHKSGGTLTTGTQHQIFPGASQPWVQVAMQDGGDCAVSPVMSANAVVTENQGTSWQQCANRFAAGSSMTNVDLDYDNCGACGNALVNQNSACSIGVCEGGVGKADADPHAGSCWIHAQRTLNDGGCVASGDYQGSASKNYCHQCVPSNTTDGWTTKDPPKTFYRCVAHMWADKTKNSCNAAWAFFSGSTCTPKNGSNATYDLNQYYTNHLCAHNKADSSAGTDDVSYGDYWDTNANPGVLNQPTFPSSFEHIQSRNNFLDDYTNTSETRSWFFWQHPIQYLGQMNNVSLSEDGRPFWVGRKATNFQLKPGQEKWFAFYYNDRVNWQDRIGVLTQFDNTYQKIKTQIYFVCAYSGDYGHARLDGFRYCSAEGFGSSSYKSRPAGAASLQDFNVQCGASGSWETNQGSRHKDYSRYSSCSADIWQAANKLPWKWYNGSNSDYFGSDVPAGWGLSQGGTYVEGSIDCGAAPSGNSSGRSGWALIKVSRESGTPAQNYNGNCFPITLRFSWFHHAKEQPYRQCWYDRGDFGKIKNP